MVLNIVVSCKVKFSSTSQERKEHTAVPSRQLQCHSGLAGTANTGAGQMGINHMDTVSLSQSNMMFLIFL